MANSNTLLQFARYVVAGGAAFVLDFVTLLIAVDWFGMHYLVGATLGFGVGSITCYLLSVAWVFDERRFANPVHEMTVFIAIGVAALAINNATMWLLVEAFAISYAWAKVTAAGVVMVFNFGLRRFAVFSEAPLGLAAEAPVAQMVRIK